MKQHKFTRTTADADSCARCSRPEVDHTPNAKCEECDSTGECELLGTMLLCIPCLRKEYEDAKKRGQANYDENVRIQQARKNPIGAIASSVKADESIETVNDFFNAEVTSIAELRAALNGSTNSEFELAKLIQARYQSAKEAYFAANRALQAANSQMKAQAQSLNDLASKLTTEQREQTKLADLNYQPTTTPTKAVSKPKTKITIAEKMALNLMASRLTSVAKKLVDDGTCQNIEEAKQVAIARGLVMTIEKARKMIEDEMGLS